MNKTQKSTKKRRTKIAKLINLAVIIWLIGFQSEAVAETNSEIFPIDLEFVRAGATRIGPFFLCDELSAKNVDRTITAWIKCEAKQKNNVEEILDRSDLDHSSIARIKGQNRTIIILGSVLGITVAFLIYREVKR